MTGRSSRILAIAIAVLIATAILIVPVFAQTSRGTVGGTVRDAKGGVLPGATVELINVQTVVSRSTIASDVGLYRFDAVDLGQYDVKVTFPNFKTFTLWTYTRQPNV